MYVLLVLCIYKQVTGKVSSYSSPLMQAEAEREGQGEEKEEKARGSLCP